MMTKYALQILAQKCKCAKKTTELAQARTKDAQISHGIVSPENTGYVVVMDHSAWNTFFCATTTQCENDFPRRPAFRPSTLTERERRFTSFASSSDSDLRKKPHGCGFLRSAAGKSVVPPCLSKYFAFRRDILSRTV